MPRKLKASHTFDFLEDDCMFTIAALQADENSADLVPQTDPWLPAIDEVRLFDRKIRQQIANIDAGRIVANTNLDIASTGFGDELYLSCGKDRKSSRWLQFFKERVSDFNSQSLTDQVRRVIGWLQSITDPTLENHRAKLTKWSSAADTALNGTAGLSGLRGQVWQKREALTKDLTDSRDNLFSALVQRAQQRGLPRDWAATFFRVESRSEVSTTSAQPAEAPAAETAPPPNGA